MLSSQAVTDTLTGLANRRQFEVFLEEHVNEARRYGPPLSLLVLDLDHFKRVNDQLGHLAGDEVLRAVSDALTGIARDSDLVARYGGEEFAVVLPQTDAAGAEAAAERCRTAIDVLVTTWDEEPVRVTASVGVATYNVRLHESAKDLFADVDGAVYAAKVTGRNRVCVANDLAPEQRLASA